MLKIGALLMLISGLWDILVLQRGLTRASLGWERPWKLPLRKLRVGEGVLYYWQ